MRPRITRLAPDVWMVREQAGYKTSKPLFSQEHPNLVLRPLPFRRSHPIRSFFSPNKGKGNFTSTKLYVGNLAFQTTSQELQDLFAQAGTVESASVVEDRMTGRSRGFAFVEMASPEDATAAVEQLNGKEFGGRNLTVNEARPRTDRGPGNYGNRGGY